MLPEIMAGKKRVCLAITEPEVRRAVGLIRKSDSCKLTLPRPMGMYRLALTSRT